MLIHLWCCCCQCSPIPNEAFRDMLREEIRDDLREEIRDDLREEIIDDIRSQYGIGSGYQQQWGRK